jgi:hypothetical protein
MQLTLHVYLEGPDSTLHHDLCLQVESVTAGEIIASAARGDVVKLKKAIEAGNDLDTVDDHGKTALMVSEQSYPGSY